MKIIILIIKIIIKNNNKRELWVWKFSGKLAPLFLDMFKHSYTQGSLLPSLTQAFISPILKKDKEPFNCSSFRLISLLPVERRLEAIMTSIILEDQTGFIRQQHLFINIQRFLGFIHPHPPPWTQKWSYPLMPKRPSTGWSGHTCSLHCSILVSETTLFPGFGYSTLLSKHLCAQTHRDNNCSKPFPLSCIKCQGCPLSALLLAITTKSLSIALKTERGFFWYSALGNRTQSMLHADDFLLFMCYLSTRTPQILSNLNHF